MCACKASELEARERETFSMLGAAARLAISVAVVVFLCFCRCLNETDTFFDRLPITKPVHGHICARARASNALCF